MDENTKMTDTLTEPEQNTISLEKQQVATKSGSGGLLKPNEALKRLIAVQLKMSLGKLAKKSGISKSHLSRWLNGHRPIGKAALAKLGLLGLPVNELYGLCPTCGQQLEKGGGL